MLGAEVDVVQEHLVECMVTGHIHDGTDAHPWSVHRADEVRDACMLGAGPVCPGQENPEFRKVGIGRPDLLPRYDPSIAVCGRSRRETCQVRPRSGLTEELAPDF